MPCHFFNQNLIESVRQDWEDAIAETKAVLIDLKKAFDTIKHIILLENLSTLGLRVHMQNLLQSYLSNRQQCVNSKNVYSKFAEVGYAVPQ